MELRAGIPFGSLALLNWIQGIRPFAFPIPASATFFLRSREATNAGGRFSTIEPAHFMKPERYFAAKDPTRRARCLARTAWPDCGSRSADISGGAAAGYFALAA